MVLSKDFGYLSLAFHVESFQKMHYVCGKYVDFDVSQQHVMTGTTSIAVYGKKGINK